MAKFVETSVKWDKLDKVRVDRYLRTFPKRADTFLRDLTIRMGLMALDIVRKNIPAGDEYKSYRNSLKLKRIKRMIGMKGVAIVSEPSKEKMSALNADVSVIYIERKRRRNKAKYSKSVLLMMNLSPWTVDTLPFVPMDRTIKLVYRKVSKKEAGKIRIARKADARRVREIMVQENIKPKRALEMDKKMVLSDSAFIGLRLEFGMAGHRGKAHWRPMVRQMKTRSVGEMYKKDRYLKRTLWDPEYGGWVKPVKRLPDTTIARVQKFQPFQRKIT